MKTPLAPTLAPVLAPVLALTIAALGLAACQPTPGDDTPFSTPSQDRPAGVPQTTLSDGDLAEDGDGPSNI